MDELAVWDRGTEAWSASMHGEAVRGRVQVGVISLPPAMGVWGYNPQKLLKILHVK
jgi:hypothetical protein